MRQCNRAGSLQTASLPFGVKPNSRTELQLVPARPRPGRLLTVKQLFIAGALATCLRCRSTQSTPQQQGAQPQQAIAARRTKTSGSRAIRQTLPPASEHRPPPASCGTPSPIPTSRNCPRRHALPASPQSAANARRRQRSLPPISPPPGQGPKPPSPSPPSPPTSSTCPSPSRTTKGNLVPGHHLARRPRLRKQRPPAHGRLHRRSLPALHRPRHRPEHALRLHDPRVNNALERPPDRLHPLRRGRRLHLQQRPQDCRTGFTAGQSARLSAVIERSKGRPAATPSTTTRARPCRQGIKTSTAEPRTTSTPLTVSGGPGSPQGLSQQQVPREAHTLNDAILLAATGD